jgi:hypothetical protein
LATKLNPGAGPYHLISVNANLDLGAMTSGILKGTSLSLHVQHLLDDEVFLPSSQPGGYEATENQ